MPKFVYPIILICGFAWFEIYQVLMQKPTEINQVYWLLFLLFVAVTLTLSFLFFWVLVKKNQQIPNTRPLFRKALKYSIIVTSGPIIYLGLRALSLATTINSALLGILYVMILIRLGSKSS